MKKSALLLTVFVLLGACQEEILDPQLSDIEIEEAVTEILEIPDSKTNEIAFEEELLLIVEEQATFEGGTTAWNKHLKNNLVYPAQARRLGIEGRVHLTFAVSQQGNISNAQLVRGIGAGCDKVALELIKASPNWKPAIVGGIAVNSTMSVVVVFRL